MVLQYGTWNHNAAWGRAGPSYTVMDESIITFGSQADVESSAGSWFAASYTSSVIYATPGT